MRASRCVASSCSRSARSQRRAAGPRRPAPRRRRPRVRPAPARRPGRCSRARRRRAAGARHTSRASSAALARSMSASAVALSASWTSASSQAAMPRSKSLGVDCVARRLRDAARPAPRAGGRSLHDRPCGVARRTAESPACAPGRGPAASSAWRLGHALVGSDVMQSRGYLPQFVAPALRHPDTGARAPSRRTGSRSA